jgi:hypothetical protein
MGSRVPPARRLLELGCDREPARDTCVGIDLDEDAARAAAATGVACIVADARRLTERGLPAEPRNGIDPDELTALATAAGFQPLEWSVSGDWTHATPPYVDQVFASPAVTDTIRVPAGP